jgi:nucleoside phosphorylase
VILAVAAVEAELGGLPGAALGVGPVRAAASLARLLAEERPDGVVLVGSAGSYRADHSLGRAYVAESLGTGDAGAAVGGGYVPLAPPVLSADPVLRSRVGSAGARVLTLAAITTAPAAVDQLARDWDLEHMEAYAAAWACRCAGVPFLAVLGVANRVGPAAHDEWRANRAAAEAAAREAVLPLLDRS